MLRIGLADNSAHKLAADDGSETNDIVGDGALDNESRREGGDDSDEECVMEGVMDADFDSENVDDIDTDSCFSV